MNSRKFEIRSSWFFILMLTTTTVAFAADGPVEYNRDVKPILKSRCYSCHGVLKQKSGLRLDTGVLIRKGGESGPAVVPGKAAESLLLERITETDELLRMPPEGKPLTAEQIAHFKAWISQGAKSPSNEQPQQDPRRHWAFRVPVRPSPPKVKNPGWVRNPIDAFIAASHEQHGLTPRPPAKKEVLLRRVYFDLTGLPPTRRQLDSFLADDSPQAYEKVVDHLLHSQHYGERWGRHWMDVWRYSDWYGRRAANDVRNGSSQIWRWRDWIISSLNSDKGYDRMILEMLAGDEIAPDDPDVVVATGFIVRNCYRLNFHTWKQDMVEHTAKAFLGLTFNCAHCHDHKYDPITQENYFQLRAFFEPLMMRHDRLPGQPDPGPFTIADFHSNGDKPIKAGLARVFDGFPDEPTRMYHRGDPRNILKDKPPIQPGVPGFLGGDAVRIEPIDLPTVAFYPGAKDFIRAEELQKRVEAVSSAKAAFRKSETELSQKQATLQIAIKTADAERKAAEAELSQAIRNSEAVVKPGTAAGTDVLAEWRFEGDEEEAALLDSSGNELTLLRSTGNDERVGVYTLPFSGKGRGFFRPIPQSGAPNRQAVVFDQNGGQSFLYTIAGEKLHADEFTLEMCLQIDTSQSQQRGTLVNYEGVWELEHHRLNSSTSELRLRLRSAGGKTQEISSNQGKTPLILVTGHDYYIVIVLNDQHVTFYARDLTLDGDLQSIQLPRKDTKFAKIAQPGKRAGFNIGRSRQGQRHRGLLDELRLMRGGLSQAEIADRSTISRQQQRLAKAEQELVRARDNLKQAHLDRTILKLKFEDAQAQQTTFNARIAADRASLVNKTPDADTKAVAANQTARAAAVSAAKWKLAQAMQALAKAKASLWSDPKQGTDITKAEQQLNQAREQVTTAIEKLLEPPSAEYRSLTQVFPRKSTGRRTALAQWIAHQNNPLTARVAINHIWLRHFGRSLVESVFDFGRSGKQPTHPELLDWLSVEFMESGWKMKSLHRLIVTSNTYRMQSKTDEQDEKNIASDSKNRYLWHFNERRMEAEIVRDSLLATADQLDATLGGLDIDTKFGETISRRSLYFTIHPEGGHLKFMSVFDPPNPLECYRRDESVVPQQALALTNSRIMLKQSRLLARKLWEEVEQQKPKKRSRESAFISGVFARILSRYPTSEEQAACSAFLQEQVRLYQQTDAKQLAGETPKGGVVPSTDPHMRARESLVGTIFNHNDFVTIR
jgi:hypothetical protein